MDPALFFFYTNTQQQVNNDTNATEPLSTNLEPPKKNAVKRPQNAFMLYRSDKYKEFKHAYKGVNSTTFSVDVGKSWKAESNDVQSYYRHKASLVRSEFYRVNPDYKYNNAPPKKGKQAKKSVVSNTIDIKQYQKFAHPHAYSYFPVQSPTEEAEHCNDVVDYSISMTEQEMIHIENLFINYI